MVQLFKVVEENLSLDIKEKQRVKQVYEELVKDYCVDIPKIKSNQKAKYNSIIDSYQPAMVHCGIIKAFQEKQETKEKEMKFNIVNEMIVQNQNRPRYKQALTDALPDTQLFLNGIMGSYDQDVSQIKEQQCQQHLAVEENIQDSAIVQVGAGPVDDSGEETISEPGKQQSGILSKQTYAADRKQAKKALNIVFGKAKKKNGFPASKFGPKIE